MPSTVGILSGAGSLKNPAEAIALGYRINYISNPSFEVDASGWGSVGGATLTRVTSESNTGSAALQVTNTSASGFQTTSRIPFLGGQGTYVVSAYIKLGTGATTSNYFLRHLQYESLAASGTVSSGNVGTTSLSDNGNWTRISGTFTRNSVADYFIIRVSTSSTTSGDIYYVDSIMVEKANSVGSYFDGSSGGFWTGASHGSFSGGTPY
jgi:hypothetical protein